MIGAVLIDIEKAFDSVWLEGLIHKLVDLRFRQHVTHLIADMIFRKSFIMWNGIGESSNIFVIRQGLQQGIKIAT